MRAVGLMKHGGPEVLEVLDVPEVHAGPGQVRLRNHAAAVSPTDTMVRNGARAEQQKVDPPPYVPGMDAAGIVDQVGEGIDSGILAATPGKVDDLRHRLASAIATHEGELIAEAEGLAPKSDGHSARTRGFKLRAADSP